MVKLSEQLDARPTRTQRVGEQQKREVIGRLQGTERQRIQSKVDTASAKFKNISYEDYASEYNKLDPETKQFFTSPSELKQTEGYQTYVKEKTEYSQQVAKYEAQQKAIASAQRDKAEWDQAYSIISRGSRYDPRSRVGFKIQKIHKHRELALQDYQESKALSLKKEGLKPIYRGKEIIGYEDPVRKMSFPIDVPYSPPTISPQDPMSSIPFGKVGEPTIRTPEQDYMLSLVSDKEISPIPPQKDYSSDYGTYNAQTGLFQKYSEPSGQATAISRVPTTTEQKEIDFVDIKLKEGVSTIGAGYKYVDERVLFDIGGTPSSPKLTVVFGKRDEPTPIEETFELGITKLGEVKGDVYSWAMGKQKIEDLDISMQKEFQETYQTEYELSELTPTQFEKSTKAILLQKEFQEKYGAKYKELSQDTTLMKKILGGTAYTGLSLGQLGLGLTKTPTRIVTTGVGVYTGVNVLKLIPTFVQTTAGIGLTAYGGYKTFSPTSTIEEVGGGVVMLGTGGLSLGYAGAKWWKTPIPKPISTPAPKISLKASEIIGKDYGTKVIFDAQKLSQQVSAGQRVVVKTKGREIFKLDPIYKGVPYADPKGYQQALKKLTKYGYTPSQAKAQLRYTAPKVRETGIEEGLVTIKGEQALAEFSHLIKQPVIKVDDLLGIKTRGARTIKKITIDPRELKGDYVISKPMTTDFILEKGKFPVLKDIKYGKGIGMGKATDLKKGYEYLGKDPFDTKVFKEAQVQDIYGVAVSRTILPSTKAIHIDISRTKLISKVIDQQTKQFGLTPAKIKKTPFSKTFGSKPVDEIKDIIRGEQALKVSKVIPEQASVNIQQLKSAITPDIKPLTKVKDLIKIKQLDKITGVKMGKVVSTKVLLDLKSDVKLKTDLKSMIKLKDILKEDTILKLKQAPALKTAPAFKTDLKLKQSLKQLTGLSLKIPIPKTPTPPKPPKITTPTIVVPPWLKSEISKKLKKKKKGKFEEFALLPDFTARAIGLDPEIITGKQAQARIKKILTGMEVRRGVVIK